MSAEKKRMATELRSGKYPEWIFGDADHIPISEDTDDLNEYIVHTAYQRFIATITANGAVYNAN